MIGMDTIKVKNDTTKSTEHIRSIFELKNYLNANKQNQLRFACKYYDNDNHTSVPLIAEYDALRFIFDCYHFDYFSDDYKNLENLYETISKCLGYKVKPPESIVNSLAYTFLYLKHIDEAKYLFKLNVTNYPDSWNVYDSIGDYYAAKDDKANAIDSYKKALSIKEVPDTRKKLENFR